MEEYTFRAHLNGVTMPGEKSKPCKIVLESWHREEVGRLAADPGLVEITVRRLQKELPGMNGAKPTVVNADVIVMGEPDEVAAEVLRDVRSKLDSETGEILGSP